MIRSLIVYINSDRSVFPKELKIANQFEIKTNEMKFIFDGDIPRVGYFYLVLTNLKGSFYLPLINDKIVFDSSETWITGGWSAHIMISKSEIVNGAIEKSNELFISDDFGLLVEQSDINIDDLKEQELPKQLKLIYDDLFNLKKEIEEIISGGVSGGGGGKNGLSAYELAVQQGFVGSLDEWLESLKGEPGSPGTEIYFGSEDVDGEIRTLFLDQEKTKAIFPRTNATAIRDLVNAIYPIGSIYISVNSVSPSVLFGGKWEAIQDRFLLASGRTYLAGSVGGESVHKLTEKEIPSHAHNIAVGTSPVSGSNTVPPWHLIIEDGAYTSKADSEEHYVATSLSTGDGIPHNNLPPYLAVYMWKRTA